MLQLIATSTPERRNRPGFVRYGVSAIAVASVLAAVPALAQTAPTPAPQDDDETQVEEVVVTGIRGSLQNSQTIKRNAEVFVDSISAQDIGALPDRSVSEALQRVPGVAIDRFTAGVDPDHFAVEGSGVVVRGLTFVRSEFNGRDAFTANNGRALGFADVPSELLAGVDVFKNQSADLIEGGIAGTVNLRTRVPFDQSRDVLSASAEYSYGDLAEELTPTYSILGSKRWDTEYGEFGLLANFVDSQLKSRSDGQQISNFSLRTNLGPTPVYFPRGASFRSTDFDRTRTGYAAAGQWRSPDHTMIATAQFLRSEATQDTTEHAVEIATDNVTSNGDSRPVFGTTFEFGDDGVFTNGTITGPTGWRDDQQGGRDNRTPSFGLQSNNQRRDARSENITTDYGFNFKWTPTDRLKFNFDIQRVESTVQVLDATLWASTYQNASIQLRGDDAPIVTFLPPSENGTVTQCPATPPTPDTDCPRYFNAPNDNFSNPFNSFVRNNMDHAEDSEGELTAVRLDGEYTFDEDSWLDSVRFGYRRAEREQTTRFSAYNWGVISEQWGGGGPVWLSDSADGVPEPGPGLPGTAGQVVGSQFETFAFDNFYRGQIPVPTGNQPRLFYNQNIIDNYDAYSQFGLLVGDEWRARLGTNGCPQNWVPLAQRCDVVPGSLYRLNEINPIQEQNDAFYGMLRYAGELSSGVRLSGNVGVRYTTTDRQAQGYLAFPRATFSSEAECAATPPGQTATPFCRLVSPVDRAAARAFANGAITEDTAEFTYDYLLPSFNLRAELDGGKVFRFGYSRAITPPDIGLTRNYFNVNLSANELDIVNGRPTGRFAVGNPRLKPIMADSFDASFEWYYGNPGSFTFSLFYKTLSDVITNGTERQTFTNNGATFDAVVTTPVNSEKDATVQGFEVAWQHTLDDLLPPYLAGFGFNANYTYIDSEGVPQSTLSNTDPDVAAGRVANIDTSLLPLQNLSEHTANLAGFYEHGPVAVRLAYAWRSEFLITPRDVIVPFAPIMNESTGQLDASAFYSVTDQVKVGMQAVNLTNEVTRTSQVLNNDLLTVGRSWFMNDRRFTFIVRATF
ncbi:TonB-dependent receptor [Brevundimonas sp. LM2]|uniref:TonB-dependent receptor n=1 Tax=Brevundimonas sp. LM2 TaxID=1938605 RepID=UPI000983E065|nr:TonB-dependent receptor [Brevundimonas sp. LM2]AQR63097.1 TonB-dependent receptor [Brevundimonas sp. LM2]